MDSSAVGAVEASAFSRFSFSDARWVSLGCASARKPITDVGVD